MKKYLCLLAFLFASPAEAGVISIGIDQITYGAIGVGAAQDWAIWGVGANASLAAPLSGTGSLFSRTMGNLSTGSPLRALGQFDAGNVYYYPAGGTYVGTYGGLQHDGQGTGQSMIGEGFSLTLYPTGSMIYNVYGESYGGTTAVTASGEGYQTVTSTIGVDVPFWAHVSVEGTAPVTLTFALATDSRASYRSSNVSIAAVGANVIAPVPEPSSWLLAILGVIGLYKPVKKYRRYLPRLIDAKPREQDSK
jgi:hypothetical protein